MKKTILLITITIFAFTFYACSNDDNDTEEVFEFAGEWNGNYSGDETGTWSATITENGTLSGIATATGSSDDDELNGTVTSNGTFTATVGTSSFGSDFVGQLSGNSGNGTWNNTSADLNGTWSGNKQ